jgi:hypothetical protein
MKGGSILANFRLRKMEQNATQGRLASEQKRQEENRAFFEQQRRQENAWIAEQERERREREEYEQRIQNMKLQYKLLLSRLQANQENRLKNTKKNKKLYRNTRTSRNLLKRGPVNYIPNWGR